MTSGKTRYSLFYRFLDTTRTGALMNDAKPIGLDAHQATISVAILDSANWWKPSLERNQNHDLKNIFRWARKKQGCGYFGRCVTRIFQTFYEACRDRGVTLQWCVSR